MGLWVSGWPLAGCFALGCQAASARHWAICQVLSAPHVWGMRDTSLALNDIVEQIPLAWQATLAQAAKIAQRGGANATASKPAVLAETKDFHQCVEGVAGEAIGCRADCVCAWHQRCYPKHVVGVANLKDDHEQPTTDVDIGVCDLSISASVLLSAAVFAFSLMTVISLRMYLDWKEELAEVRRLGHHESDDADRPKPS